MTTCRLVLFAAALASVACSASSPSPQDARSTQAEVDRSKVFVEAVLVDVAAEDVSKVAEMNWTALSARATVVSSPHLLAEHNRSARLSMPTPPGAPEPANPFEAALRDYSFEVTPLIREGARVELELFLKLGGPSARAIKTTWLMKDGATAVHDTGVEAGGRHLMLLVTPTVIRDQDDMQRLFEQKKRARDVELKAAKTE